MDKKIKDKIDVLLHENAMLQSNLGIDSTKEEIQNAKKIVKGIKKKIASYDKEFAEIVFPEKYI
jgi:hypothetical protein